MSLPACLRGLIRHEPLDIGEGLLIKPCQSIHTFGVRFPIDAIFIDSSGRAVLTTAGMCPNWFGIIVRRAALVIELPARIIATTGTQVGDQLRIHT